MKRLLDIAIALCGLLITVPLLLPLMFMIWRQDHHTPLYISTRVGKNGTLFHMVKLRSMIVEADRSGVESTTDTDPRITVIGHLIRRYKLDELTQLWNVLRGDMSLVGPRPNTKRETDLYTEEERGILSVQPGITDMASIIFADQGSILNGEADPALAYMRLIWPWKSRLGLIYIEHHSLWLDIQLIFNYCCCHFFASKSIGTYGTHASPSECGSRSKASSRKTRATAIPSSRYRDRREPRRLIFPLR